MQDAHLTHPDIADTTVTPLKGLMIMASSVLAMIAAVAIPVVGEPLFAALFYGKSVKKVFGKSKVTKM